MTPDRPAAVFSDTEAKIDDEDLLAMKEADALDIIEHGLVELKTTKKKAA